MIQASWPQVPSPIQAVPSPIQAEAAALLLAAKAVNLIHLQQVTFLKDNLSLARAAASPNIRSDKVLWEIRETMVPFFQNSQQLHAATYHITTYLNGVAHDCAHQASSAPVFRCNNSAHSSSHCPFSDVFTITTLNGYVLHSVYCT